MPTREATAELLASREDVWTFLEEPHHLADWWPGIGGVKPDRRGLAPGARWEVYSGNAPTLLRKAHERDVLLVDEAEPPSRLHFRLNGRRLDVELRLDEPGPGRTTAHLRVRAPWLVSLGRGFPEHALARLHNLVQTGARL
ncbi:MAG TPA: SRPBCC family protein [Gaiellaceae bacterium]|nr:SRPBCC family protein [Gaiellaceae bacterium]